ncbi:MAG: hypothetical protein CLLPBCKN_006482 [Chroococcidiopsis cubana SAG 39.79]|nr:hypothetical protein [Chroococcidiopsis cubana SAG 39.79]PSB61746.1 hypothetical protein C7B79_20825 [Chroococcidiopsis cubana CCALA 043]
MLEILDLGISDEEYLQLIAQGRDAVQEQILIVNLIRAGVPALEAIQVAPMLKKSGCSSQEKALIQQVWQRIRSQ